jgi:hypothetical protein
MVARRITSKNGLFYANNTEKHPLGQLLRNAVLKGEAIRVTGREGP